jgi:PLP dependent protein
MNIGVVESNLKDFWQEMADFGSKNAISTNKTAILYATKYLNPQEFVDFVTLVYRLTNKRVLIGENRVQAMEEKMGYVMKYNKDLHKLFHPVMIGSLQTNKINKAIPIFQEIHSIDSLDLAKDLDQRLTGKKNMPVYLEVNVSQEQTKHGFKPEELEKAISTMKQRSNITIKGLMTMAPQTENIEEVEGVFRTLRKLADQFGLETSMGMSSDWKIALLHGSDMVRIGSRIFSDQVFVRSRIGQMVPILHGREG